MKPGDQLSRKIVANLAWRYRFARRMANRRIAIERIEWINQAQANEAWNAYMASKRILMGIDA